MEALLVSDSIYIVIYNVGSGKRNADGCPLERQILLRLPLENVAPNAYTHGKA